MTRVLLLGAAGRMGCAVQSAAQAMPDITIVAGVDRAPLKGSAFPVFHGLSACGIPADVLVEFSSPQAVAAALPICTERGLPCVLCTTGLSPAQQAAVEEASAQIPVFQSANMSLGVAVLARAARLAAKLLPPGCDIEIIEKHHRGKRDAPSGTALLLADAVNDGLENKKDYTFGRYGRDCKRNPQELGIHAVRGGTIPGEHTVLFAGNDELIEIRHTALSKKVFASGAVTAAKYLVDQAPGLYNMEMLIDN